MLAGDWRLDSVSRRDSASAPPTGCETPPPPTRDCSGPLLHVARQTVRLSEQAARWETQPPELGEQSCMFSSSSNSQDAVKKTVRTQALREEPNVRQVWAKGKSAKRNPLAGLAYLLVNQLNLLLENNASSFWHEHIAQILEQYLILGPKSCNYSNAHNHICDTGQRVC